MLPGITLTYITKEIRSIVAGIIEDFIRYQGCQVCLHIYLLVHRLWLNKLNPTYRGVKKMLYVKLNP